MHCAYVAAIAWSDQVCTRSVRMYRACRASDILAVRMAANLLSMAIAVLQSVSRSTIAVLHPGRQLQNPGMPLLPLLEHLAVMAAGAFMLFSIVLERLLHLCWSWRIRVPRAPQPDVSAAPSSGWPSACACCL